MNFNKDQNDFNSKNEHTVVSVNPASSPTSDRPSLCWHDVGFAVNVAKSKHKKVILSGQSGSIHGGQLMAIMGTTGAGKSTLLNCLSGRLGPGELCGSILFNGMPRDKKQWKSQCAFVEQDDLMYRNLTVEETLTYSAFLRLPQTTSLAEKKSKVNQIIRELGLEECRHVQIGDAGHKGISGGERKRVAIGMELLTDPNVLFLDEPTSGLDAFTALSIVKSIQKMAVEKNRIVIMTIHQPRATLLDLFDKVLLLSEGKAIWSGSTEGAIQHFSKLGYPLPENTNASDYFLDIASLDKSSKELEIESKNRIKLFQEAWQKSALNNPAPEKHSMEALRTLDKIQRPLSWIRELGVLLHRNMVVILRDGTTLRATLIQNVIMMLIIGGIFYHVDLELITGNQNRLGAFFFICVNQTFLNVLPTILVFPEQRQIMKRERAAGTYRASSAYLAKVLSTLPLTYLGALILALPVYWMIGLQNSVVQYLTFICIVLVQSHTSAFFGLVVGAAAPNAKVGLTVAFPFLIVMILFAGQLVNLKTITPALRWLQYLSVIAYSNKALAQNEFRGLRFFCPPLGFQCISGEQIMTSFGLDDIPLWYCVLINVGISLGLGLLGYFFFLYTSSPSIQLVSDHAVAADQSKSESPRMTVIQAT